MDINKDEQGLTSSQAARRLAKDGPNLLPSDESRLSEILFNAIKEPMFLLLIAAACLYFILGDLTESLILLFMVAVTVGITLYQEGKTEKTLHALRDLSSPRALVIRDGTPQRIPGKELVAGDIMLLSEGDRVAADAVLLSAMNLQVDESLLTGEFFPVSKHAAAEIPASAGDPEAFKVRSGTLVVQGAGTARVTATGIRSELGKIGTSLQTLKIESSPLQIEIRRIVKFLAIVGVLLSCIITLIAGLIQHDWLKAVLIGIALAMSLLPEEFSVILAVFPAIGAWRLSRAHVLTRRLAAIETLGAISVLCTDKTGTLTENRMTVEYVLLHKRPLVSLIGLSAYPEEIRNIAEMAALASKSQPFDPMEKAFHALAQRFPPAIGTNQKKLIREYPLTPGLRVMSNVWQVDDRPGYLIVAKGAPEEIIRLCGLSRSDQAELRAEIDRMAEQGHRTLAVAYAEHEGEVLPDTQAAYAFKFMGLVGLNDPLRREIPAAIEQCSQAGIRVIMITGDHPTTAAAIARQAGMAVTNLLSGDDIERLNDDELRTRLRNTDVLARISPFQKLRIVEALKKEGLLVGMTGDGVNDAPALKSAHVGIAMGAKGTDVAREAAPFVLLDDNFASIVHGIRLGRQIFANMQHSMSYILAIHVPIGGIALLPILLGWPPLLYPLHIAFMELIIDPACALAFENQKSSSGIMEKPPRKPNAELLGREVISRAFIQGLIALLIVAATYGLALKYWSTGQARALGFIVLVLTNLALIFSNLHKENIFRRVVHFQNPIPWIVAAMTILGLIATLKISAITKAFNFTPLDIYQLVIASAIGIGALFLFEAVKAMWRVGRRDLV